MKPLIQFLALLVPMAAFAGGGSEVGGGGNGVVCFDGKGLAAQVRKNQGEIPDAAISHIASVEMFDLYEARLPRGIDGTVHEVVPIGENEPPSAYIERIARRFDFVVPRLAKNIRNARAKIRPENIFLQPRGLKRVDDANEVSLVSQENCVLSTMAVQYSEKETTYLHIDARLFNHPKHSRLSKSVLLLHEYSYLTARLQGQADSRNTRSLMGMLITQNTGQTVRDLMAKASDLGFILDDEFESYVNQALYEMAKNLTEAAETAFLDFSKNQRGNLEPWYQWANHVFGGKLYVQSHNSIALGPKLEEKQAQCDRLDTCSHYLKLAIDGQLRLGAANCVTVYSHHSRYYGDRNECVFLKSALTPAQLARANEILGKIEGWRNYRGTVIAAALRELVPNWKERLRAAAGLSDAARVALDGKLSGFVDQLQRDAMTYSSGSRDDAVLTEYHGLPEGELISPGKVLDFPYYLPYYRDLVRYQVAFPLGYLVPPAVGR